MKKWKTEKSQLKKLKQKIEIETNKTEKIESERIETEKINTKKLKMKKNKN